MDTTITMKRTAPAAIITAKRDVRENSKRSLHKDDFKKDREPEKNQVSRSF